MNRAQRRQQSKSKPKHNRSSAIYLTPIQMEFEAFDTIERLFLQIRNGELMWSRDGYEIMGLSGEMLDVNSALEGWLKYWRELADQQNISYDDSALRKLGKSLRYEKPMTMAEVDAAYLVVEQQRRMYRSIPRETIAKVTQEVRKDIAIENECLELIRAAA